MYVIITIVKYAAIVKKMVKHKVTKKFDSNEHYLIQVNIYLVSGE